MKKIIIACVAILVLVVMLVMLLGIELVKIANVQSGSIVYTIGNSAVNSELNSEDLSTVVRLFDSKVCTYENPSCGFDEEFQIILNSNDGPQVFYIAQDACGLIFWKNKQKYFTLSDQDNSYLRNLLNNNYGCNCHSGG